MPSRHSVEIVIILTGGLKASTSYSKTAKTSAHSETDTDAQLSTAGIQRKPLLVQRFRLNLLSPITETGDRDAIAWLIADGLSKKCSQFNLK